MAQGIRQAEERLLSAIAERRIPHACFISCPDLAMAAAIAKRGAALHCMGDTDVSRLPLCRDCIIPEDTRKEPVRELIAELAKSSFSGGGRAVLFIDAHTISPESQNLLLKTMEEPPQGVLFLLTGNEAGILPTILSRTSIVRCGMPSAGEVAAELMAAGAPQSEAQLYAAEGGTLERASRLYRDEGYRALRRSAQDAMLDLLGGKLPFDGIKALAGPDAAHFMLSLMGDILSFKTCGRIRENADRAREISAVCPRFTLGRIKGIIEALADTMERLGTPASPQSTFTKLYTEITEER